MSANSWFSDLTNRNGIIFSLRFYLMKCLSTLTWLVGSCGTWLWEMLMAALLSQNKFMSELGAKPISVSNLLSQRSSQRPLVIPRNSTSTLDNVVTFCFLFLHVTRFPPTNVRVTRRRFHIRNISRPVSVHVAINFHMIILWERKPFFQERT